jgi:hypothetical protein
MNDCIYYKKGYGYQLIEHCVIKIGIKGTNIYWYDSYLSLMDDGILTIFKGYAWDGPSGPTIDTKNFMRGSLVHDALYQLIRNGCLPKSARKQADIELKRICIEDGMSKLRASWVYWGVRMFAKFASESRSIKQVFRAPWKRE